MEIQSIDLKHNGLRKCVQWRDDTVRFYAKISGCMINKSIPPIIKYKEQNMQKKNRKSFL